MNERDVARQRRHGVVWAALYLWAAALLFWVAQEEATVHQWLWCLFLSLGGLALTVGFMDALVAAIRFDQELHFHTTILDAADAAANSDEGAA